MAVFRVEKNRNYTVMSNYHLRDQNLSLKSKGLMSMILSLPEGWHYSTRGLAVICKEGVGAISAAVKELEQAGYVKRNQLRGDHGRLADIEYIIYEQPCADSPCSENPRTVNPDTAEPDTDSPCSENPAGINKDITSPEKTKTDISITDTSNPYQSYPEQQPGYDGMGYEEAREIVKENIEYTKQQLEDDDDEEEYIITMGDYMARIHLEVALYETLNCLVHGIRNLPDEGIDAHALKTFADKSAKLVNDAFFSSGITKEFMADSNPDHISELLEETLLIPEDAGYISWRDYEESDPAKFCNGERCCEFADRCEAKYARIANGESVDILDEDADFEYDEYDENEDDMPETGEISTILDCCKHLLTVAGSQLNRLADE